MYNFMEIIQKENEVIGMIKAYTSFSGKGAFPTEIKGKEGELLSKLDYESSKGEQEPNRCGWLDLILLEKLVVENGIRVLGIRNLDVIGHFNIQHVNEGYQCKRRIIRSVPDELEQCHPIYHDFFGSWDMSNCKNWEDVPDRAKYYMRYIERHIGLPIRYIKLNNDSDKIIRIDLSKLKYL